MFIEVWLDNIVGEVDDEEDVVDDVLIDTGGDVCKKFCCSFFNILPLKLLFILSFDDVVVLVEADFEIKLFWLYFE